MQTEYENKYNALVEKCLLERDSICLDNSTHPNSASFTMSKMASPDLETSLEQLENGGNPEAQNNSFQSVTKVVGQSEINNRIQTYGEFDNKNNDKYTVKEISQTQQDKIQNGKHDILCSQCQTLCETQEIFEDHKIFCVKKEDTSKCITMSNTLQDKNMAVNIESKTESSQTDNKKLEKKQFIDKPEICELVQSIYCPVCSRLFKTQQDFEEHKHLHDNFTENAAIGVNKRCGHCKECYHNKKDLLNHITQKHEGQLLLQCFMCDKTYEKWSGLEIHEATHRLDKPYLCDSCGKSFKHSNFLRCHKRSHLDESKKKRHVCEICEKAFRSR